MCNRKEIKTYMEKITGKPIATQRRCNWNDYQFTYFVLSRGIINSVRTLLDKVFITPKFPIGQRDVKEFFLRCSKGKKTKDLNWFDFFAFVICEICKKNKLTFAELIKEIKRLTRYMKGDDSRPAACPSLTEEQIAYALIRRYGTSFNSFLTERQLIEEMEPRLKPLEFGIRLGTIVEDRKGADIVIYDLQDKTKQHGLNIKASELDVTETTYVEAIRMNVTTIGMSGYRDTGDLIKEDYDDVFQRISEEVIRKLQRAEKRSDQAF